ncbi:MAG: hypothetical protein JWN70_5275, partial [Planctomycetaceae bacterium]|nr:hypothetical protein [Planctomycetaceae bacterium]
PTADSRHAEFLVCRLSNVIHLARSDSDNGQLWNETPKYAEGFARRETFR